MPGHDIPLSLPDYEKESRMQSDNPILDDLAKLANDALGTLQGMKTELESLMRQRFERMISDLDLVGRDEFEAVREMAAKARAENDGLKKRLAALEKALGKTKTTRKRAPRKTGGAKSTAKKAPPSA